MDVRTSNLLRALDPTAVDLLLVLLEEPLSQKALVEAVDSIAQSNAHKKLEKLAEAGLIRQEPGTNRGRPWKVVAPTPTANLLTALLSLSSELETIDRETREALQARLAGRSLQAQRFRVVDGNR